MKLLYADDFYHTYHISFSLKSLSRSDSGFGDDLDLLNKSSSSAGDTEVASQQPALTEASNQKRNDSTGDSCSGKLTADPGPPGECDDQVKCFNKQVLMVISLRLTSVSCDVTQS